MRPQSAIFVLGDSQETLRLLMLLLFAERLVQASDTTSFEESN